MQVYAFISEKEAHVSAFTADPTGDNLPVDYAPWGVMNGGRGMYLASAGDPIAVAIRHSGYYLVDDRPPVEAAIFLSR